MDEDDISGGEKEGGDAPLIDLNEASIKKLIARYAALERLDQR